MRWLLPVFCWLILTVHPAAAAQSYIDKVYAQMKAAIEPDRTSTRDIQWVISVTQGDPVRWTARQARKRIGNTPRTITVFLAPDAVKGMAILVQERADGSRLESVYLPLVRRLKKFDELGRFQPILNTDMTWADAGMIALGDHRLKLSPAEQHGGKRTYKVEESLHDKSTFLRIVNWIAADSMLPLERNFYDRTDTLWKVETFLDIAPIDGVPTPQRIRMEDKQAGTFTEVQFANIHYNVDIPDSIFDPARLSQAADQPYWHPAP